MNRRAFIRGASVAALVPHGAIPAAARASKVSALAAPGIPLITGALGTRGPVGVCGVEVPRVFGRVRMPDGRILERSLPPFGGGIGRDRTAEFA